ncbi:SDR family oxidoreductase [Aquimarina algiphila]|uniref:SDR family oxidoreductase n=1 Tax=Aquimarina algiphila TaxID=2047982 RepID=UPI002490E47A|nr:SDR family oxidoreductase [Aquimarina algiphila]
MNQSKIALVTGGSRGLGKDMAINLAKKGLNVILTFHSNKTEAEKVVAEIQKIGQKAFSIQLDVSDHSQYKAFFNEKLTSVLRKQFNTTKFDFLINNAGTGVYEPFQTTTLENFKDMVHIHLMAPYFVTQSALTYLNDGGGIINISSGLTRFTQDGFSAYASMKGAVEVLSKYQAKELGSRKIRVNIVAPGAIETDFGGGIVRDNKELNSYISSTTALGRVGLPTDIGPVVAFLCTDDSNWINGQRIEVSGGVNL